MSNVHVVSHSYRHQKREFEGKIIFDILFRVFKTYFASVFLGYWSLILDDINRLFKVIVSQNSLLQANLRPYFLHTLFHHHPGNSHYQNQHHY